MKKTVNQSTSMREKGGGGGGWGPIRNFKTKQRKHQKLQNSKKFILKTKTKIKALTNKALVV